jgi:protein-tyrosine phosphatase
LSIKVLFVCLGNICRSPTADAVFQKKIDDHAWLSKRVSIDSAGTASWHVGRSPDPRSIAAGKSRGYDLSPLRARQVVAEDFETFDYILAMDESNLSDLKAIQPSQAKAKLSLFLDYAEASEMEVPDPFYSEGDSGFHHVVDLIEDASEGLIAELEARLA